MDTREGSLPWGMFRQLCPKKLDLGDCHYVPQVYHVFERGDHKEGKQVCHHVLRMEQLHKQFSALISSYGLHDVQLGDHEHTGRVCAVIWSAAAIQKSRIFTAQTTKPLTSSSNCSVSWAFELTSGGPELMFSRSTRQFWLSILGQLVQPGCRCSLLVKKVAATYSLGIAMIHQFCRCSG